MNSFQGLVDQAIALANQGYRNSGLPITLRLHCLERLSSFSEENGDFDNMLGRFAQLRGFSRSGFAQLRGGADMTMLLSASGNYWGIAYTNGLRFGQTIGITRLDRARATTFGHEIGHMYGAFHDRRQERNFFGSGYNFGFLINTPSGRPSGYRTIMA